MKQQFSSKQLETLRGGLDTESQADLSEYFDFIAKEFQRIGLLAEEKNNAILLIDDFLSGKIKDNEEIKSQLPNKEAAQKARQTLKLDLEELSREFQILETLIISTVAEVKYRITGERE